MCVYVCEGTTIILWGFPVTQGRQEGIKDRGVHRKLSRDLIFFWGGEGGLKTP